MKVEIVKKIKVEFTDEERIILAQAQAILSNAMIKLEDEDNFPLNDGDAKLIENIWDFSGELEGKMYRVEEWRKPYLVSGLGLNKIQTQPTNSAESEKK